MRMKYLQIKKPNLKLKQRGAASYSWSQVSSKMGFVMVSDIKNIQISWPEQLTEDSREGDTILISY